MSFENDTFRKACRDAGLTSDAINDFSHYYHDNWDREVREDDGYHGIAAIPPAFIIKLKHE
jgi:hypothetical protein